MPSSKVILNKTWGVYLFPQMREVAGHVSVMITGSLKEPGIIPKYSWIHWMKTQSMY